MAWEEVELQGEDSQSLPGPPPPSLGRLPPSLCPILLLPVSHPWQRSDEEQLMEGNTFHSNQAWLPPPPTPPSPPPSVCWTWCNLHTLQRGRSYSFRRNTNAQRLMSTSRTYAVFSNHRMTESMACTLQVLQNSRFPWHKAWVLWQLAQTLASMEKGHPRAYLEMILVETLFYGCWQFFFFFFLHGDIKSS